MHVHAYVCVCVLDFHIFNSTVQATCTSTSDIWSTYHCTDTLVFGRGRSLSHCFKGSVYMCSNNMFTANLQTAFSAYPVHYLFQFILVKNGFKDRHQLLQFVNHAGLQRLQMNA